MSQMQVEPMTVGACPACRGIECVDRPRFFAGQLLTEQELNSEQSYVLAKNRLHNRYLHGAGVVCGLDLVRHECEGWVTVKSGYAIDPCGADVIVCEDYSFDVLARIAECRDVLGRRQDLPCDPIRPQSNPDCTGLEEHWCVTIAYDEKEARPMTTLRREPGVSTVTRTTAAAQPCSCGGHSNGNGTVATYTASVPTTATSTTVRPGVGTAVACEPTRVFEGYKIDVVPQPVSYCGNPKRVLGATGLSNVFAAGSNVKQFLQQRVPQSAFTTLQSALAGDTENIAAQDLWQSYCYARNAMVDLEVYQPAPTLSMRTELDAIQVSAPPQNADDQYKQTVVTGIGALWALFLRYFLSRICSFVLPPCSPDPQDDRLILGCLTIVDGKITRICDLSCRKYAGSFPAIFHWLSFYPVIPLLGLLLERFCCAADVTKGRLFGSYAMRTSVTAEPTMVATTGAGAIAETYGLALATRLRPLFEPATLLKAVLEPDQFEQALALLGTTEPNE